MEGAMVTVMETAAMVDAVATQQQLDDNDGNGNGRHSSIATATAAMVGTMQRQWKSLRRRNSDNSDGNGRRNGDSNGNGGDCWRNGDFDGRRNCDAMAT